MISMPLTVSAPIIAVIVPPVAAPPVNAVVIIPVIAPVDVPIAIAIITTVYPLVVVPVQTAVQPAVAIAVVIAVKISIAISVPTAVKAAITIAVIITALLACFTPLTANIVVATVGAVILDRGGPNRCCLSAFHARLLAFGAVYRILPAFAPGFVTFAAPFFALGISFGLKCFRTECRLRRYIGRISRHWRKRGCCDQSHQDKLFHGMSPWQRHHAPALTFLCHSGSEAKLNCTYMLMKGGVWMNEMTQMMSAKAISMTGNCSHPLKSKCHHSLESPVKPSASI